MVVSIRVKQLLNSVPNSLPIKFVLVRMLEKLFCLVFIGSAVSQNLSATLSRARLPSPRWHTAAVYDGNDGIYIAGGQIFSADFAQLMRFDISSDTIVTVANLPEPVAAGNLALRVENGSIAVYHFGGNSERENWVFKYDPSNETVDHIANLPVPKFSNALLQIQDKAFLVGGGGDQTGVVQFDFNTSESEIIGYIPELFGYSFVTEAARKGEQGHEEPCLLFAGASYIWQTALVLEYSPSTGNSNVLVEGFPNLHKHSSVWDGNRFAYVIGGIGHSDLPKNGIVRFDPITLDMTFLPVENFPVEDVIPGYPSWFYGTSSVFVDKLNRIYFFGGVTEAIRDTSAYFVREEIWYIQL